MKRVLPAQRVNLDAFTHEECCAVDMVLWDAYLDFETGIEEQEAERRARWSRFRLHALYAALIVLAGAYCGLLLTLLVKP